jgi:hypothetical protein
MAGASDRLYECAGTPPSEAKPLPALTRCSNCRIHKRERSEHSLRESSRNIYRWCMTNECEQTIPVLKNLDEFGSLDRTI